MKVSDKFVHLTIWLLSVLILAGAETKVDISPLPVPSQGKTGYQLLSPDQTGLIPQGKYVPQKNTPIRETGHSGLAAGDVNGDGLVDLYVCGMNSANALYINKGNWKFEDRAKLAGVACQGWRLSGSVFADVDGDGDLDMYTTGFVKIFLNQELDMDYAMEIQKLGLKAIDKRCALHRRIYLSRRCCRP